MKPPDKDFFDTYKALAGYIDILEQIQTSRASGEMSQTAANTNTVGFVKNAKGLISKLNEYFFEEVE